MAALLAMADTTLATDQLDHIRTELRAEIELLNSRLNALIASQSFLVIAYGSSLGASFGEWRTLFTVTLPPLFSVLGFVLVIEAWPGLRAAHEAIRLWRRREAELVSSHSGYNPYTLATDEQSRRRLEQRQRAGSLFWTRVPVIFLTAWVLFFLMPFALWMWG